MFILCLIPYNNNIHPRNVSTNNMQQHEFIVLRPRHHSTTLVWAVLRHRFLYGCTHARARVLVIYTEITVPERFAAHVKYPLLATLFLQIIRFIRWPIPTKTKRITRSNFNILSYYYGDDTAQNNPDLQSNYFTELYKHNNIILIFIHDYLNLASSLYWPSHYTVLCIFSTIFRHKSILIEEE